MERERNTVQAVALFEGKKPGQNNNVAHGGEETRRKERSKGLLLPNPYLNVTPFLHVFCKKHPPLAPFVDSFERDNKHQMGAKCTWWEYIKTWWPDSAGEGKAIVLDNKDNTNEISVLPSDDDLWVALYALTPVSTTNGPFLDRQQTTHALP